MGSGRRLAAGVERIPGCGCDAKAEGRENRGTEEPGQGVGNKMNVADRCGQQDGRSRSTDGRTADYLYVLNK